MDNKTNVNTEIEKKIDSLIGSLKGDLLLSSDEALNYIEWMNKKLKETNNDRKEKELIKIIRKTTDKNEIFKLKEKKEKYLPDDYPKKLKLEMFIG